MKVSEKPVVLLTGAARRVGRVLARTLHGAGYDVALHYRQSQGEAEQLAAELEHARADSTLLLAGELADMAALPKLVLRTVQRFGRLDALVNNASAFFPTAVGDTSEAQWDELFASNAKGPYFLAQAAAPHLRVANGCIVNLVDIYAERPLARHPVYCMAKAALAMMTKALALELGPAVRVNGVAPGAIAWPEDGQFPEAERQRIIATTPLGRPGSPEDIARAVAFFAGAPYVTGQILAVDGGRSVFI